MDEAADVGLDHGLFLTVAENLIGNAARFAQERLTIILNRVQTADGDELILSVRDDGSGSPEELVKDGPKPFGKKDEDAAHFGMGLYTSQMLCAKHGGELLLENGEDGGAVAAASFLCILN